MQSDITAKIKKNKLWIVLAILVLIVLSFAINRIILIQKNKNYVPDTAPIENIEEISRQVWESYKAEQAALEAAGLQPEIASDIAKVEETPVDQLQEAMRLGYARGIKLDEALKILELDDACFTEVDGGTAEVRTYRCSFSPKYARGQTRTFTFDENGGLTDLYIDDQPGLHSGEPRPESLNPVPETPAVEAE